MPNVVYAVAVILFATSCSVFSAVPAVRNAQDSHPPAVRDAPVENGPLRDDSSVLPVVGGNQDGSDGVNPAVNPEGPRPVTVIATATSQPEVPVSGNLLQSLYRHYRM